MANRSMSYIRHFVIGLGFFSGLWTAVGINPGEVILNALGTVTGEVYPDPRVRQLFIILPLLLLLISICGAYKKGRFVGLTSVLIAYLAGLSILVNLWTSLAILLVAVLTGYFAASRRM
jgi:hypothetical protein